MGVTTFRLDEWMIKLLDMLAKKEKVDRTTIAKKAISIGLAEIRMKELIEEYTEKRITAWKAAEKADMSLWEFLDELKRRGVEFQTSDEDLEEMLEELE